MKNRRQFLAAACGVGAFGLAFGSLRPHSVLGDMTARSEGISLGLEGLPSLIDPGAYILLGQPKSGRTRLLRYFADHCNARRYDFIEEKHNPYRMISGLSPVGRDRVTFVDHSSLGYKNVAYFDWFAKQYDTFIVMGLESQRRVPLLEYPRSSNWMTLFNGSLLHPHGVVDVRHITTRQYGVRDGN